MKRQNETNIVDFEEETISDSELKTRFFILYFVQPGVCLTFF